VKLPFVFPQADERRFDVVGFGLNSIDLVAVLDEFPRSDTKQHLRRFARLPGGQIATALTSCARLGWRARYIGSFGDEEFGRLSRQSLVDAGVDVTRARTVADATNQFAFVLVEEGSGARTVLWNRDPQLTMGPDDISQAAVQSGRVLIVDCFETAGATSAARYAREAGMLTIIDVEKPRDGIADLLRQIDAIIAAESFPSELTGYADLGRALTAIEHEFQAPLVCVTLGKEGSLARSHGREIRTPAFPVTSVDTTGAGDAFRGGFAAGCLQNPEGELEDALRYANAVAALNCLGLGARGGLPTRDEVDALLCKH
jgi:sugar/nucleoside kinase (ribokinase family)